VRAQQVVTRDGRLGRIGVPRGMRAVQVAGIAHDPGLVESRPQRDPVTERADDHPRVCGEPVRHIAIEPAALIVQCGRKVPVVQGDHGPDAMHQEQVHEAIVEGEPRTIHRTASRRQDPRPREAEAIRLQPERAHQLHISRGATVMIAGDVPGFPAGDLPGRMREAVPDARAGAVGEGRALDLVGGGCRAPEKPLGEPESVRHRWRTAAWRA
jgi:hypothetical protein